MQSEVDEQAPHLLFEHVPILQSELELQPPQRPFVQLPLPSQSELELQPPQRPFVQLPILQSELDEHAPQRPFAQLP